VTTKAKAKPDEQAAEPAAVEETKAEAPRCGTPHHLPLLAGRVTCQLPAQDPDRAPGSPDHEHRHEDGDTIYVW
jgi:hypothetical protein